MNSRGLAVNIGFFASFVSFAVRNLFTAKIAKFAKKTDSRGPAMTIFRVLFVVSDF